MILSKAEIGELASRTEHGDFSHQDSMALAATAAYLLAICQETVFDPNRPGDPQKRYDGHMVERIKTDPLERSLHDLFAKESQPRPMLSYGNGLLQDLFVRQVGDSFDPLLSNGGVTIVTTPRDCYVAATVIQWMGSNCGRAFLEDAARKVGWTFTWARPKEEGSDDANV